MPNKYLFDDVTRRKSKLIDVVNLRYVQPGSVVHPGVIEATIEEQKSVIFKRGVFTLS